MPPCQIYTYGEVCGVGLWLKGRGLLSAVTLSIYLPTR